ncbi:MAG: hypothetical protein JRF02_05125 [Deltaproteobacteria bacterium]|jgi:hypothetical protein|nr:hypothetical protein [Deltaproteobacteria bacterium]
MKKSHKALAALAIINILILIAGCTQIAPGDSGKDLVPISSIGILPANATGYLPSGEEAPAELTEGVETVDSLLADYFAGYQNVNLIPLGALQGLTYSDSGKLLYLAREAGQQLHYDAVLVTTVERYQERDGSDYAVITPASVAFSLKLLAMENGQVIWSSEFNQTQQPLLDNILPKTRSTGSGFRWLTAKQLISAGLNKKLNNCPYFKRD